MFLKTLERQLPTAMRRIEETTSKLLWKRLNCTKKTEENSEGNELLIVSKIFSQASIRIVLCIRSNKKYIHANP